MLYRKTPQSGFEILLVHPGGPFWRNKDANAWTIPKGEFDDDEDPLNAARREFEEETGQPAPAGDYIALKPVKQANNKIVHGWAVEGDFDPESLKSNTFVTEWPPRSGRQQEFPEVDRAAWFTPEIAKEKILKGQERIIDELLELLSHG